MEKIKQILMICLYLGIAVYLTSCAIRTSEITPKNYIVNPEGIESMYYFEEDETDLKEIDIDDRKSVLEVINSAKFDDEFNDGRMVKMPAYSFAIKIVYQDKTEIIIQLWENRISLNQKWYLLNTKPIEDILYK